MVPKTSQKNFQQEKDIKQSLPATSQSIKGMISII